MTRKGRRVQQRTERAGADDPQKQRELQSRAAERSKQMEMRKTLMTLKNIDKLEEALIKTTNEQRSSVQERAVSTSVR